MVVKQRQIREDEEWVNPQFKENEEETFLEEEKDEAVLTPEDIEALQPLAEEAKEEYQEYQKERLERNIATKEKLLGYKNKLFEIDVNVGDEILTFKARRITDAERSELLGINYGLAQRAQASLLTGKPLKDDEYNAIKEDGYRLLAEVIVEPKMSVEEWKENTHTALLDKLFLEVQKLQTEVDDVRLINDFRKAPGRR
ncbi:MAG: hypothetical protein GX451_08390 [Acholeplasmataceae bacterium]|nr:hypothetical protein [Acholeplasmataceae bacterium]